MHINDITNSRFAIFGESCERVVHDGRKIVRDTIIYNFSAPFSFFKRTGQSCEKKKWVKQKWKRLLSTNASSELRVNKRNFCFERLGNVTSGKLNFLLRNMLKIFTVPQFSLYICVTEKFLLARYENKTPEFQIEPRKFAVQITALLKPRIWTR